MKKITYLLLGLSMAGVIACSESGKNTEENQLTTAQALDSAKAQPLTTIEFETRTHDFGTIEQGEKVSFVYKFKNTGENDLILSKVQPSCGCTAPSWPKEPIKPQEEAQIEVIFNSKGRQGTQRKSVSVIANTEPQTTILSFTAQIAKEE